MILTKYNKDGYKLQSLDGLNENLVAVYTRGHDVVETSVNVHYIDKNTGEYWILEKDEEERAEALLKMKTDILEQTMEEALKTFQNMLSEFAEAPSHEMYGADAWLNLESLDTALQDLLDIYRRVYNTDPSLKEDEFDAVAITQRMVWHFLSDNEDFRP